MKYFVQSSSGKSYEIDVASGSGGKYTLTCDGKTHDVHLSEIRPKKLYSLMIDRETFEVKARNLEEALEITLDNLPQKFVVLDQVQKNLETMGGLKRQKKLPEKIIAEMPGVVVKVLVAQSQEVQKGDVLLVVEAMKMQNEIVAQGEAVVEAVSVSAGDVLAGGDMMVRLKYR